MLRAPTTVLRCAGQDEGDIYQSVVPKPPGGLAKTQAAKFFLLLFLFSLLFLERGVAGGVPVEFLISYIWSKSRNSPS